MDAGPDGDITATEGEEPSTGPFPDWEYHVTTIEGLFPGEGGDAHRSHLACANSLLRVRPA